MLKIRFFQTAFEKARRAYRFLEHEPLLNWSALKKSLLISILAACICIFGIAWDGLILLSPNLWSYVDLSLIKLKLWVNIIMLVVFVGLIICCQVFGKSSKFKKFIPFLCVHLFSAFLCFHGYAMGSFSPLTVVTYVSITGIGLILFDRKLIYSTLIPSTLVLIFINIFSMFGLLEYAPVFQESVLNRTDMHPFWVGSMLFFICPILIASLFLFEILLAQWRSREMTIQELSQKDPLTNIMNRRSINLYLDQLHFKNNRIYSVVLLDLDHFKQINDCYGHSVGDNVLVDVAKSLSANVRDTDIIGRFGGEEFILLLPNTAAYEAQEIAERCRQAIMQLSFNTEYGPFSISASFGISSSLSAQEPYSIISQADRALYEVKASGRNQVKIFDHLNVH